MSDMIDRDAAQRREAEQYRQLAAWLRNPWSKMDGVERGPIPEWPGALMFEAANVIEALTIRALPAVEVGVKPLDWFEVEKYRYGGKYTSEGYTIRYVEGFFILDFAGNGKTGWRFPTLEAAKAAAQADYDARIRSALTVTPAPDAGKVQALVDALTFADETFRDLGWHSKWEVTTAALASMKEG